MAISSSVATIGLDNDPVLTGMIQSVGSVIGKNVIVWGDEICWFFNLSTTAADKDTFWLIVQLVGRTKFAVPANWLRSLVGGALYKVVNGEPGKSTPEAVPNK